MTTRTPSVGDLICSFADVLPYGFAIIDEDLRYVWINRLLADLNGFPPEYHVNRRVREILSPAAADAVEPVLRRVFTTGIPVLRHDRRVPDGIDPATARRWRAAFFPIRQDDEIVAVGGIVAETTAELAADADRNLLQERLRQAEKMEAVGRLAGGIAHDFNNLLTVMAGFTELVFRTFDETDPRRDDLLEVRKAAARADTLTRQILAFGRRQLLEPRVLDLNALVAGVEPLLRRTLGEDVELILALGSVDPVRVDATQFEQVLLNLALNARDAMPDGGQLRFATTCFDVDEHLAREYMPMTAGRYVSLTVSDTGVGMTPETQRHVFEPFFTTKPTGKGTGLGLSTVYGIVEQSGGSIWVHSEIGRGTSFDIHLPAVDAAIEAPASPSVSTQPVCGGAETILLVEDDGAVRRLAAQTLTQHGYTVLEGRDGEEALAVARQHRGAIHLLVSDVVMPGRSGPALVAPLQAEHAGIRVLYTSGYTEGITTRAGATGNVPLLAKPFLPVDLLQRVREVLDMAHGQS